ncbi:hypothetical protein BC332_25515 [Capsicum chinense]|nr:hypothetical protein BC332_25515 [Capsicum chinense]
MWLCRSFAGTQLMMLVDYAGSVFPSIAHSPWNGVRVVDFVMPFFLFVVGVSLAIVNKVYRVPIVFYTLWVVIWSVKCSVRGDVGPACNSAGMIDRHILGIDHLYAKPVYRNMKECNGPNSDRISENMPSWCHAAFDPEGSVSSLTAAATSIIGLQYGHILVQFQVSHEVSLAD